MGVWPRRIPKILGRYSAERIEANFERYRKRAREGRISNPGGWLATAIEKGYVLPTNEEGSRGQVGSLESEAGLPSLKHEMKVSQRQKNEYVRRGLAREEEFEKFSLTDDPGEEKYLYYDFEKEGPDRQYSHQGDHR